VRIVERVEVVEGGDGEEGRWGRGRSALYICLL
jgi:hypothetical protein